MPLIREGGLRYQGDSSFQESDSSHATIDVYGLDDLTRSFIGRPSLINEFLRRYPPGTADNIFPTTSDMPPRNPGMTIVGIPIINKMRAWTEVTFELVGKMGVTPSEPLVKIVDSWQEDTVQVQPIIGQPAQLYLDYKSPSTTYEYCSQTRPTEPRYSNGALAIGEIEIIRKRGLAKFNGEDFGAIDTWSVTQQRLENFTREQVGTWWRCSEQWKWVIVPQRTYFNKDVTTVIIA